MKDNLNNESGKDTLNIKSGITIFCECGAIIPDSGIEFYNSENEEGEEFGKVEADCPTCKKKYETFQWGHFDDEQEALECLIENTDINK